MLKLCNVSKFYYQNGMIATGFSKVNLELNMGEFVVITGESGSGKSTLLNVLSGLDKYEEGEMYINGEETSHYDEKDFEEYRRKYVGNIFQNFNLVNSYTVYQNVELALLLNGEKKRDVKSKILDIIDKVGLSKYKNTKCSKLSGGQKQRVAIARALAKDTPIIVADEPTGNLDSKSATEVIALLREIAKDKLVIIVTHNIDQVEAYATRLIKMYDGKIVEDKYVSHPEPEKEDTARKYKDITLGNQFRLGVRNTFNVPTKFILTFIVFLFVAMAISGIYGSLSKEQYDSSILGINNYFTDTSDNRIVIRKTDNSEITEEDYTKILALGNIKSIEKCDPILDTEVSFSSDEHEYVAYYGMAVSADNLKSVKYGRLPENENEIVIASTYSWLEWSELENAELILTDINTNGNYFTCYNDENTAIKYKIVGMVNESDMTSTYKFYVDNKGLETIRKYVLLAYSDMNVISNGNTYSAEGYSEYYGGITLIPTDKVNQGECVSSPDIIGKINDTLTLSLTNKYISKEIQLKVTNVYTKSNVEELLGRSLNTNEENRYKESGNLDNYLFINPQDYEDYIAIGNYQSSVFIDNVRTLDSTNEAIENMGYTTLVMRDSLYDIAKEFRAILNLIKGGTLLFLTIALFFIAYFVVKLVMKSRNAYFSTVRTLGASRKIAKHFLDVELMTNATIAYLVFIAIALLVNFDVIKWEYLVSMATYLTVADYIIVYAVMLLIAFLIGNRYSRRLFKDSVMANYREVI